MPYRYVGLTPDELASGRPLAFGDEVTLSRREVVANARLIRDGRLIKAPSPTTSTTQESDK